MNDSVKPRQLGLLLLLIIPGDKLLALPSMLAKGAGRDSWLVMLILLLLDLVCMMFVIWAIKLNKDNLSFYDILCKTITKVGAKIIMAMFFLFFALRLVALATPTYELFTITFNMRVNFAAYIIIIALFTIFMVSRGFNSIARVGEIIVWFVLLSLLFIVVMPLLKLNVVELLPVLEYGISPVFSTITKSHLWFADYIFIYFLINKISSKDRLFLHTGIGFGIAAVVAVLINVLLISVYGELTQYTNLAMSKLSQFALGSTVYGRVDWLNLSLLVMSIFMKMAIYTWSAYQCIKYLLFPDKEFKFYYCLPQICFYVIPLFVNYDDFLLFARTYFGIPYSLLQYLLPLVFPLLVVLATKKGGEEKSISKNVGVKVKNESTTV